MPAKPEQGKGTSKNQLSSVPREGSSPVLTFQREQRAKEASAPQRGGRGLMNTQALWEQALHEGCRGEGAGPPGGRGSQPGEGEWDPRT